MQMESASFWEEVMEGDGNEYNGSGSDAHRNSTASGPFPLSSRDKGEASKKKAPIEGAEGRKLPPPVSKQVNNIHALCQNINSITIPTYGVFCVFLERCCSMSAGTQLHTLIFYVLLTICTYMSVRSVCVCRRVGSTVSAYHAVPCTHATIFSPLVVISMETNRRLHCLVRGRTGEI